MFMRLNPTHRKKQTTTLGHEVECVSRTINSKLAKQVTGGHLLFIRVSSNLAFQPMSSHPSNKRGFIGRFFL